MGRLPDDPTGRDSSGKTTTDAALPATRRATHAATSVDRTPGCAPPRWYRSARLSQPSRNHASRATRASSGQAAGRGATPIGTIRTSEHPTCAQIAAWASLHEGLVGKVPLVVAEGQRSKHWRRRRSDPVARCWPSATTPTSPSTDLGTVLARRHRRDLASPSAVGIVGRQPPPVLRPGPGASRPIRPAVDRRPGDPVCQEGLSRREPHEPGWSKPSVEVPISPAMVIAAPGVMSGPTTWDWPRRTARDSPSRTAQEAGPRRGGKGSRRPAACHGPRCYQWVRRLAARRPPAAR